MKKYKDVTKTLDGELDHLGSEFARYGRPKEDGQERTMVIPKELESDLPGVALSVYGDMALWRNLMHYNGIRDPLSDVCSGAVIRIPSRAKLTEPMGNPTENSLCHTR